VLRGLLLIGAAELDPVCLGRQHGVQVIDAPRVAVQDGVFGSIQ